VEVLEQIAEQQQNAPVATLRKFEGGREIDDGGVDRLGLDRRNARGVVANRRQRDSVVAPALATRRLADQPACHRAGSGDADLLPLQIVERLDRTVVAHHQSEGQRRVRQRGDPLGRDSLDEECQPGTRAEADVDAVGGHGLLHARVAAEAGDFEIDAVLPEDSRAHTDVARYESEGFASGLAHPQRLGRPRR
jgi:hypothetical protein